MNQIILIGNLTRDPESRTTHSGHTVCNFDIAVNSRSGGQDATTYFRISAWDKTGEACQRYLSKGKKVFVSGPMSVRMYQSNSGETRVSVEIAANDVEFLSARDNDAPTYKAPAAPAATGMIPVETDELPF